MKNDDTKLPIPLRDFSHVLRAPLTVIKAQVLLAKSSNNVDVEELAYLINEQVELASSILDDISLLANAHQGRLARGTDKVDIAQLAKANLELLKDSAQRENINLRAKIEDQTTMVADKIHINLIFNRLLKAAMRDSATEVKLTVTSDKIQVSDNGLGTSIDEEMVLPDTPKYSKRTSIGIMTVKTICDLYNLKFEVSSGPQGSELTIRHRVKQ